MSYYKKLMKEKDPNKLHFNRIIWDKNRHILNVNTGPIDGSVIWDKMATWLAENLGGEAWPLHGVEGAWIMGSDTIDDWTLIGFNSEANMRRFQEEFPHCCRIP